MPMFNSTRRVKHSPEQMFALVADVEKYPQFLPLCEGLIVRRRTPREGGGEVLPAPSAEPRRGPLPRRRERDARATGVVGVGLAPHQTHLDALLHQPRRPRLIHSDRLAELAHAERVGCRVQRFDQPQPCRAAHADRGAALSGAGPGRRRPDVVMTAVATASAPHPGRAARSLLRARGTPVAVTAAGARTPPAQTTEGGIDGIEVGVGG